MNDQNIYDNEVFFNGYKHLRETNANYNDQLEQPAMAELIPDISRKSVLDLGCDFGQNCIDFVNRGAKGVVGIDISEKMLETANTESADEKIRYINMNMNDISGLKEKFDLVYSSLAFHYVEDLNRLAENIYSLLNDGGYLLFSHFCIRRIVHGTYRPVFHF